MHLNLSSMILIRWDKVAGQGRQTGGVLFPSSFCLPLVQTKAAACGLNDRENDMTSANVLAGLAGMLASGGIEVVDCTGVLGPDTPLLKLPPDFAKDTPKVEKTNCTKIFG